MTGPATPGQEGPSFAPPSLPQGWIAQWDGISKKYYFVQLSTGQTQWDTPTSTEGHPGLGDRSDSYPGEGAIVEERGPNGPEGDRGLGQMALKYAMQSAGGQQSSNHGQSSNLMGIAGQLLGGGKTSQNSGYGSHSSSGAGGLVGALAGSLLGGGKQSQPPQNYSGAQPQQQYGSGLMGKVTEMFGGHSHQTQANSFGYSTSGNQQGGYAGQAPPTSYQPAASPSNFYQSQQGQGSYNTTPQTQQHPQYNAPSHNQQQCYGTPQPQNQQHPPFTQQQAPYGPDTQTPYGGASYNPTPSYPPPPPQYSGGQPPQEYGHVNQGTAPGNLTRPEHGHHGHHNFGSHEGGLYGSSHSEGEMGGPPPVPHDSRPYEQGQGAPPGSYGHNQGPPPGNYGPPSSFGGRPDGSRW